MAIQGVTLSLILNARSGSRDVESMYDQKLLENPMQLRNSVTDHLLLNFTNMADFADQQVPMIVRGEGPLPTTFLKPPQIPVGNEPSS